MEGGNYDIGTTKAEAGYIRDLAFFQSFEATKLSLDKASKKVDEIKEENPDLYKEIISTYDMRQRLEGIVDDDKKLKDLIGMINNVKKQADSIDTSESKEPEHWTGAVRAIQGDLQESKILDAEGWELLSNWGRKYTELKPKLANAGLI